MKKLVVFTGFILSAATASAQWTEKYPVNVQINNQNVLSAYLVANFGKIGEIVAKRLDAILKDPVKQAKMAGIALQKIQEIYDKKNISDDDKAKELLKLIEADLSEATALGYEGQPAGGLQAKAAFSPKYNVMRLTWKADRAGPFNCTIYNSGPNGGSFSYVSVNEEGAYNILRNGKTIARIAGWNSGGSRSFSDSFTVGNFRVNLSVAIPKSPGGPDEVVFYDYDPYQGNVGSSLRYSIESNRNGCASVAGGQGGSGNGWVGGMVRSDFYVDSDGDSVPDFMPVSYASAARNTGTMPGAGSPVNPGGGVEGGPLTAAIVSGADEVEVRDTNQALWQAQAVGSGGYPPYGYGWVIEEQSQGRAIATKTNTTGAANLSIIPVQCEMGYARFKLIVEDRTGQRAETRVTKYVTSRPWNNYCP